MSSKKLKTTRGKILYRYLNSIENIGETLLVLKPFRQKRLIEKWVLERLISNRVGKCALLPLTDVLLQLALLLRLIERIKRNNKEFVYPSKLGYKLLAIDNLYEDRLTKQQGTFLFSNVLFDFLKYEMVSLYELFQKDNMGNIFINSNDSRINFTNAKILRLFQQLKLATYVDGNIIISKNDAKWIDDLILPDKTMTESSLLKLLQKLRRYGKLAEEYALREEKEHFLALGRCDLVNLIERISHKHVKAGYDIVSFTDGNKTSIHDKFIEVKGSTSNEVIFYITKNELETAKALKNNYWIYYVCNIKIKGKEKLQKFQNPYEKLFKKNKKDFEPILWKVAINNSEDYFNQE